MRVPMRDAKRVLAISFVLALLSFVEGVWLCKETQPFLKPDEIPSLATLVILSGTSVAGFLGLLSVVQSLAALFSKWVAELKLRWLKLGDPTYFDMGSDENVYLPAGGLVGVWLVCGSFSLDLTTQQILLILLFGALPAILQLLCELRIARNDVPDG